MSHDPQPFSCTERNSRVTLYSTIRPPMPYYGGKQRIANQIVSVFPPHLHYVEPFAGGLSILLAKAPSRHETINDIDQDVMTFWRVLRDRPEDLIRVCTFTPHARMELNKARDSFDGLDELEVARRVWVQLAQGRAGRRTKTGWRFYVDGSTVSGMNTYLRGYVERMPPAAARLLGVQLECMPALDLIRLYGRSPGTLMYVDPPYLSATRRSRQYKFEMDQPAEHEELAQALHEVEGEVVLSGYHSDLYDDLYKGWARVEIEASTQQIGANARRVEVLWCNFDPGLGMIQFDG